jgi:hypothetical protein
VSTYWEEVPKPPVKRRCKVCFRYDMDDDVNGVVSPTGVEHHGHSYIGGDTLCGKDATGANWWWPL